MAISRFKTSTLAQGLPKYQDVWDGVTEVNDNSYESIATATVGSGGASFIEFTSIPQTYKHLEIRSSNFATSASWTVVALNSDTSTSSYAHHRLGTDGGGGIVGSNISNSATNYFFTSYAHTGASIINILNYSDTTRNKTIRGLHAHRSESSTDGEVNFMAHLWMNTSAVTSIKISLPSVTFQQHTTFALYGIKE